MPVFCRVAYQSFAGKEEGLEEGLQEGGKQKQWEIARQMKVNGIAVDVIVRCTEFTFEDMERL